MSRLPFIVSGVCLSSVTLFLLPLGASAQSVKSPAPILSASVVSAPAQSTQDCTAYTVKSGDTLSNIASAHSVTWPYLAQLNRIADPDLIFPDQVFAVCGDQPATASVVTNAAPAAAPVQQVKTVPAAPAQQQVKTVPAAPTAKPYVAPPQHSAPAPAPVNNGGGSVQSEIIAVFGANAQAALNVARCESGFNPGATNRSSAAAGVFQFLPSTWRTTPYAGSSPYNADANIRAAYSVFVRDGYSWREWSCRP